ncbi:anti-sigma regulatory factor (Ser/Thr protein kinase) [Streptomyces sp. 3330]|uniref:ATP-binding protein n=1 Tax=Streptomyces sp. 3330 TaxID=2817755 RepID=UPI00285651D8|nr:ATP-binding protein [Streptomyces sp. 3330]MDR6980954.1 anti-sigma regulatory factor (Ser/Thr protein kinase) [Streptomyces sp. 3330]
MEQAVGDEGQAAQRTDPLSASAAYDGASSCIGDARRLATGLLTEVQAVHGLPVSERALGMTQLVVSELVTNAVKYAPGPVMLDLQVSGGAVRVSVWDSDPVLPEGAATDPERVGRHGLEITLAVCQAYEVRRELVGKRVTALIALADNPGGGIAGRTSP